MGVGDDVGSVEELWTKWGADLLRYATALVGPDDASDAVAGVMLEAVTMFEPGSERERLGRPYVYRMLLNRVRMDYRSRTRRERREWKAIGLPDHVELLADPMVVSAVARLSVMQRAVVFLTYWEDLSPAAVALQLDVSEGTVKRHLARARNHLRKVLQ